MPGFLPGDKMKKVISSGISLEELFKKLPQAREMFEEMGIPCTGCVLARYDTLAEMTEEFNLDLKEVVGKLNRLNNQRFG